MKQYWRTGKCQKYESSAERIVNHDSRPEARAAIHEMPVGRMDLVPVMSRPVLEDEHFGVGIAPVDDGAIGVGGRAEVAGLDVLDRLQRLD